MFFRTYQILKFQVKGEIGELCLSLCAFRNGLYIPSGTATSIAPNFAITAKHVIDDYFEQLQQEFLNFEGEKEVLFGMVALQPFSYIKILSVWQVDKYSKTR